MDEESGLGRQDQDAGGNAEAAAPETQPRQSLWRRAWNKVKLVCGRVTPGPRAWHGAAIGLFATGGLIYPVVALFLPGD